MTVNVYTDLSDMEDPWSSIVAASKKVNPDLPIKELVERSAKSREVVKGEIFLLVDEAIEDNRVADFKYININYMKVKEADYQDYVKMEQEMFKPVHQARIKAGSLKDWSLYQKITPMGAEYPYQYVTAGFIGEWSDFGSNDPERIWQQVHGEGSDPQKFTKKWWNSDRWPKGRPGNSLIIL